MKFLIPKASVLQDKFSNLRSLKWKLGFKLRWYRKKAVDRKLKKTYKCVEIEIDQTTVLSTVPIEEIVGCKKPSQAIIVPEIAVEAKQHELSVLSDNSTERELYVSRTFNAREMALECLFDHYWFPKSGFLISRNGKVWRHSILGRFEDPNFLSTGAVGENRRDNGTKTYAFYEHLLWDARVIHEPYLITSHYASHNYGHFLLDMVPLIQLGMKMGLRMFSRPMLTWHKPIYQRVGVDPNSVAIVSEPVVFFKKVFVSNRHKAMGTRVASPNLRNVFAAVFENIPQSSATIRPRRRIYLSRGGSQKRNLRNREALESVLQQEGFEIIRPELMPFDDQALLFADADIIVSEFGANMANVVFCRKGTKIVEIIPDLKNDPWSRHLCASLDLEHVVLCHPVKDGDRKAIKIADRIYKNKHFSFDADIELIKDVIKQLR